MVNKNNKYTIMQKNFYNSNAKKMTVRDHNEHNENPNYWDILLGDLSDELYEENNNVKALDFGCGTGRNVLNLLKNWNWKRVDGVDISENNIIEAKKRLVNNSYLEYSENTDLVNTFEFYSNNGIDLSQIKDNEYDFVMSTIVFQHICVYDIRYSLLQELYRVMKFNGILSIQFGYGVNNGFKTVGYYDNYYDAKSTNSDCNVRVDNPNELISDLKKIGFKVTDYKIKPSFSDAVHPEWIYVKAKK